MGSGCGVCSNKYIQQGVNDLATTYPEVTKTLVNPTDALKVHAGSSKKLLWQCSKDPSHQWEASVRSQTGHNGFKKTGCRICTNKTNLPKKRKPTLAEVNHPILNQAVDPKFVGQQTLGSGLEAEWHCPDCLGGHTYTRPIRKQIQSNICPVKTGKTVLVGFNDLHTTHPKLAAELVDQSIGYTLSQGSELEPYWRCTNNPNHIWKTYVYARVAGNNCPECNPIGSSYGEQKLFQIIQLFDPQSKNRAIISSRNTKIEVDILSKQYKLAIEFNGVYWHSTAYNKDPNRHLKKLKEVNNAGYQLITVWEDDWNNPTKKAILLRNLTYKFNKQELLETAFTIAEIDHLYSNRYIQKIGARSLRPTQVTNTEASVFFEENHIQGKVIATYNYALVDEKNKIRAVLAIRSPKHNTRFARKKGQWEIQRYATLGTIPGGFSRLLNYALNNLKSRGELITSWTTISANESSEGNLYKKTGFTHIADIPPNHWYTGGKIRGLRVQKESYQKRRFQADPDLKYKNDLTERELAALNNMFQVYDSGKKRWEKQV